MATPEQNALLSMQLFEPLAQTGNILLAQSNRAKEEQLRRDLATQGYDRSIQLAELQANREDARTKAAGDRQQSQIDAMQQREDTRQTALQQLQDSRVDAADKKQLHSVIASTYPKYAAEATRLGEKVRPIDDFDETWEGLGDLQAEMAKLEQTRLMRDQDAAATAAVGELDDAARAVEDHKKALAMAMKPTPDDEKFAHSRAVESVKTAIETGDVTGAPKSNSQAAKKGFAALTRGDRTEAAKLLGDEVLSTFDTAYEAALQASPNFKGRMQQLSITQQNYLSAQRNLAQIQSDLRKAAAQNNALATKLTTRRSGLQNLMSPLSDSTSAPQRTFDQITPKQTMAGVLPTAGAAPMPQSDQGNFSRGASALADIGRSELGRIPGFNTTANALGMATRYGGQKILNEASSVGNTIIHPGDTFVQYLEAIAAKRRADQEAANSQQLVGAAPE